VQLRAFANHVTPSESLKVVHRDPDDDTILECAAARSDYVVTGDKDLLEVGLHRGARIIMPAVFLALTQPLSIHGCGCGGDRRKVPQ
jgi:predicted nucleic acid-binding protein